MSRRAATEALYLTDGEIAASPKRTRRISPAERAKRALEIAREAYGDAARITVNLDGSITIDKGAGDGAKKQAKKPEPGFVL